MERKKEKNKARVRVYVKPKEGILDPQGKTVENALHSLGYKNVENMRIGKFIEMDITGADDKKLASQTDEMCKKLLANPVIEDYAFEVYE